MVEELATDYASYLSETTLGKEIRPLCLSIDDISCRLDEFEVLLSLVQNDTKITKENIESILAYKDELQELCKNIESVSGVVSVLKNQVEIMEEHVSKAEEELGMNKLGIKKFLKPIFGKNKNNDVESISNGIREYVPPPNMFCADDYFGVQTKENES